MGVEKKGSLTNKLKEDLRNRDYESAAAHMIYKTSVKGLKKRNIYRVVHAWKDLKPAEQSKVRELCQDYFDSVYKQYKGLELAALDDIWK